jgi:hypothetical protein
MKVFGLTFAYNETFYLPRWVAYYGAQLGLENLFILDHGSSDLSCFGLGPVNIIKVPRSPYDEVKRVDFASHAHAGLLNYYDAGFVTDVDEFLVANPLKYANLAAFAHQAKADALAAIGLELFHVRSVEATFNAALPILFQRRHVLFDSWLCKRSFGRIPMRFGGGFHTSDQPVVFNDDFYLIHLKNFNYDHRLLRQATTAKWTYSGEAAEFGTHAKQPVEYVNALFDGIDARVVAGKVSADFDFSPETNVCLERTVLNPSGEYDFNLNGGFQAAKLNLLPPHFWNLF